MRGWRWICGIAGLAVLAGLAPAAIAPIAARSTTLPALTRLMEGSWELRERGSKAAPQRICAADPLALMQVRHAGRACSRFVIDSQSDRATVHYTCPGVGHGRTTLRVETNRLVQIETQGFVEGAPFQTRYEGRFVGPCR